MSNNTETTRQELRLHGITSITDGSVLLLGTVTIADNSQDIWLECIDDNGDRVRLVPDTTGWQDGRREVMAMNITTGKNQKLFFQKWAGIIPVVIAPHKITLADDAASKILWSIPSPCIEWAALRAK